MLLVLRDIKQRISGVIFRSLGLDNKYIFGCYVYELFCPNGLLTKSNIGTIFIHYELQTQSSGEYLLYYKVIFETEDYRQPIYTYT